MTTSSEEAESSLPILGLLKILGTARKPKLEHCCSLEKFCSPNQKTGFFVELGRRQIMKVRETVQNSRNFPTAIVLY